MSWAYTNRIKRIQHAHAQMPVKPKTHWDKNLGINGKKHGSVNCFKHVHVKVIKITSKMVDCRGTYVQIVCLRFVL